MARAVRYSVAVTVGFAALLAALSAVGDASAYGLETPFGFATGDGSFVLPYSQGLISTSPVTPGSTVFGDVVYLEFLNSGGNRSVTVTTVQRASGQTSLWYNESFAVGANVSVLTLNLPSSTAERTARVCVELGCITFLHLTPLTLLPSGILSVGGLDFLAFGLTAEFGLLIFPLTVAARALTRKALWTPKFKAWLVAPHVALGFILLVGYDYQAFDQLFGGLGFVLIPVVFAFLYFLWVLHLFNTAKPVEVLQPDLKDGHAVDYYRALFWVGDWPDGSKVAIGPKWSHWLARLFGHAPVVVPRKFETGEGAPAESDLMTVRTETRSERTDARTRRLRRAFRRRYGRQNPLDSFPIHGGISDVRERDPPQKLYWVDSDGWLRMEYPRLSVHRTVTLPAKLGPEGNVVEPARQVVRLAWPHYVDTRASVGLAGFHYLDVPVAAVLWGSAEKAYRRVEQLRAQNVALRTTTFVEADDATAVLTGEIFRGLDRERTGLTDEEADEETRGESPKPKDTGAPAADAEASPRTGPLPSARTRGAVP